MSEHETPPFTFKHILFWLALILACLSGCAWMWVLGP
jgi:hypothetical protein